MSPRAASPAPTAPMIAPAAKPAARPWRDISQDIGLADSIEPRTIIEIGSVAQQGLGDKA